MNDFGLVLYVDGGTSGCNPGPCGSGMHGYIYDFNPTNKSNKIPQNIATQDGYLDSKQTVKKITTEDTKTIIDSDKPYEVNVIEYLDWYRSINEYSTNNVAELNAMMMGLKTVLDKNPLYAVINSDSNYTIAGLNTYLNKWKANNWQTTNGKEVSNKSLWLELDELIQQIKNKKIQYKLKWVKGHVGDLGNTIADELATMGANESSAKSKGFDISEQNIISNKDIDIYWKEKAEPHPFLTATKRVYWNPHYNPKNGTYYLGNLGDKQENIHLGKNVSDCGYCVVRLNDVDPVIEKMKDFQEKALVNFNFGLDCIVAGSLDIITLKKSYNDILKYGYAAFNVPYEKPDLYSLKHQVISEIMIPPYLSMRSLDALSRLNEKLTSFINGDFISNNKLKAEVTEVTDYFYDYKYSENKKTKEKHKIKTTLKSTIGVGVTDITIPVGFKINNDQIITKNLKLTFGIDLPKRNILKNVEKLEPKIFVTTEQLSGDLFQYETIIVLNTGEAGIWAASNSNTCFNLLSKNK